jgi:hypothetical protein
MEMLNYIVFQKISWAIMMILILYIDQIEFSPSTHKYYLLNINLNIILSLIHR